MINKNQHKKKGTFTTVDKSVIEDERLTWAERGILIYLLAKPPNWIVRLNDIQNRGSSGTYAIRSAMKNLAKHGYAERVVSKGEKGKLHGSEYHIYEVPIDQGSSESKVNQNEDHNRSKVRQSQGIVKQDLQQNISINNKEEHINDERAFFEFLKIFSSEETGPVKKAWKNIPVGEQQKILAHATKYIRATPNIRYRKTPINYLEKEEWKNLIISRNENTKNTTSTSNREISRRNGKSHPRLYNQNKEYEKC